MFNNEELRVVFEDAFGHNVTYGRTCKEKLGSCKSGAYGLYALEMTGCVSAGVGIGALSFWCAGCVGAAVGSGCAIGATAHCQSMLDDCQDKYNDCVGK